MKKVTDKEIAEVLDIRRQTLYNWKKKQKPEVYQSIKSFFLLKENKFFSNFRKIKSLAKLIKQECDSKYIEDLVNLIEENDEVVKEINRIKKQ